MARLLLVYTHTHTHENTYNKHNIHRVKKTSNHENIFYTTYFTFTVANYYIIERIKH